MTPKTLIEQVSDKRLSTIVEEALAWRKTGVMVGPALQDWANDLVRHCGFQEEDSLLLQLAENLAVVEAATRFVAKVREQ